MTADRDIIGIVKELQRQHATGGDGSGDIEQAIWRYFPRIAHALLIAVGTLKSVSAFKGNMHVCRECHGDAATELAKEAQEALSRIRSL